MKPAHVQSMLQILMDNTWIYATHGFIVQTIVCEFDQRAREKLGKLLYIVWNVESRTFSSSADGCIGNHPQNASACAFMSHAIDRKSIHRRLISSFRTTGRFVLTLHYCLTAVVKEL